MGKFEGRKHSKLKPLPTISIDKSLIPKYFKPQIKINLASPKHLQRYYSPINRRIATTEQHGPNSCYRTLTHYINTVFTHTEVYKLD